MPVRTVVPLPGPFVWSPAPKRRGEVGLVFLFLGLPLIIIAAALWLLGWAVVIGVKSIADARRRRVHEARHQHAVRQHPPAPAMHRPPLVRW